MKSWLPGIFSRAFVVFVLGFVLLVMIDGSSELHNHRREVQAPGMASSELLSADKDSESESAPRTATGGIINTLLVFLTVISFIGNAMFLVYVFWLSK